MSEDEIRRKQDDLILMGLVSLQKEDPWEMNSLGGEEPCPLRAVLTNVGSDPAFAT